MTENVAQTVIDVLKEPAEMLNLTASDWNDCLLLCNMLSLTGRLADDAKRLKLWDQLPTTVQQIFESAHLTAKARQRQIIWEINRVRRAFHGSGLDIVVLKGGAYIQKDLKASSGRMSSDLDILFAKKDLDQAEKMLLVAGWEYQALNDYDEHYYREWAHELPPLMHPDRGVSLDVHHTILPVTSRLKPDINKILEGIEKTQENIFVFSAVDMFLHSVIHQFHDGEVSGSFRNLLEQYDMFLEFSEDKEFVVNLQNRARELGLERPLYYSLKTIEKFFGLDLPEGLQVFLERIQPNIFSRQMMHGMIARTMMPGWRKTSGIGLWLSRRILYYRSHWLRMPLSILIKHFVVKSLRSMKGEGKKA